MSTFRSQCDDLRDGLLSFADFVRGTRLTWRGLAAYLYRRWTPPAGVTIEDVEQELLLGAWRALGRWAPARSTDGARGFRRYLVWNACDKAKKWLHVQRGAGKRGDRGPGRYPLAMSTLERGGDAPSTANHFAVAAPAEQEDRAAAREALAAYARPRSRRERWVLAALWAAHGSVNVATDALYASADARRECRFGNRSSARTAVMRAVLQVCVDCAA